MIRLGIGLITIFGVLVSAAGAAVNLADGWGDDPLTFALGVLCALGLLAFAWLIGDAMEVTREYRLGRHD